MLMNDTPLKEYDPEERKPHTIRFTLMEGDFKGSFTKNIGVSYEEPWYFFNPNYFMENLGTFEGDIEYREYDEERFLRTGEPGYYILTLTDEIGTRLRLQSDECDLRERIVSIQLVEQSKLEKEEEGDGK